MSVSPIWWRQFVRSDQPDKDTVADAQFRAQNFTDLFGQFLQRGSNANLQTFDEVLTVFWNQSQQPTPAYNINIFVIADGAFIPQSRVPGGWFDPNVRLLAVITPRPQPQTQPQIFVVGPSAVKAPDTFLQAASWDGTELRFYGVDSINGSQTQNGWVYQGTSFNAFNENPTTGAEYLGPFDGHVNGATIMKELHTPWYHWYSGQNGNFLDCISTSDQQFLETIPYLTAQGQDCFQGAAVQTADNLERVIKPMVTAWYFSRLTRDFSTATGAPKPQPTNVHRWMAHLLLTTTVNFATSSVAAKVWTAPLDHFFNNELLSQSSDFATEMLPDLSQFNFTFDINQYNTVCKKLRLSLLQEIREGDTIPKGFPHVTLPKGTLGGGKETDSYDVTVFVEALPNDEGVPFVVLQTAYEDAQGVLNMQTLSQVASSIPSGLLSNKAVKALLMSDFWNPVYSWRRGVMMQYLPEVTNLVSGPQYDLESNFVAAVKASSFAQNDKTSPEYQFVQLYETATDSDYQQSITNYLTAVCNRLATAEGLEDYLRLAESRRRIFRPLPLDEFGVQLPYALNIDPGTALIEMTETGEVQAMPARGVDFINTWTGSLHGYDPEILPFEAKPSLMSVDTAKDTSTLVNVSTLPKANAARCPVAPKTRLRMAKTSRCPAMASQKDDNSTQTIQKELNGIHLASNLLTPTWQDDVGPLFKAPYWTSDPAGTGEHWHNQMCSFSPPSPQALHLDLWDRASVARNAVTVYQHLRSKSMPITSDPTEYWPDQALETFRLWANQGFRDTSSELVQKNMIIAAPNDTPVKMRVRKDILSLTYEELQTYRAKLDDILQVGQLESKWQELGFLHAEWCLHYQEGFALWHRAYLKYVEEQIDFPIPYWNCYAGLTSDPSSEYAGIPSIFLEETYIHPSGQTRKNPLKYALAANGSNKMGTGKYVERYQVLVDGPSNPAWAGKVKLFDLYHQQIAGALAKTAYSYPEGETGYPWANLPAFTDHQDTSLYPDFARQYFDGSFEQPHDNYHGWIGPDMADNTYTGFDPIFLSYHANVDRIVEMYIRAGTRQFTSSFPLRPFTNNGTMLAYSDPREYVYTTIGDMAKPSQASQYLYAAPFLADYSDIHVPITAMKARGGTAIQVKNASEAGAVPPASTPTTAQHKETSLSPTEIHGDLTPYVIFPYISCLQTSFQIDVFVANTSDYEPDPISNSDFVGRMTRLGMGPGRGGTTGLKNRNRCLKNPVARLLHASRAKERLAEVKHIEFVVTDLSSGKVVEKDIWKDMPGFMGHLVWV